MAKIAWKPSIMLAPVPPVLVSCGDMNKPNLLTIAWSGVVASDPAMTYISVRKERYSHSIISETKEFVINLTTLNFVDKTDFCGVKSGKDVDKFKETGLTATKSTNVKCPQVLESPVSIECKVKQVIECGSHDMFLSEIVAVNVDDKYIDENNKFCMEKTGIVAYAHGNYYTLGRELGKYGFSVEKKKKKYGKLKQK
ncbi:MAG: flavin reductase family protein [Alphaproteobacteria bacterium]